MTMLIPIYGKGALRDYALIDEADFPKVGRYRWSLSLYAARHEAGTSVYMHRSICGLTPGDGLEVDHINRDKLDNRRANLRVTDRPNNCMNVPAPSGGSSRYRGVSFIKARGTWYASASENDKTVNLGNYATEELAAAVVAAHWAARSEIPLDLEAED